MGLLFHSEDPPNGTCMSSKNPLPKNQLLKSEPDLQELPKLSELPKPLKDSDMSHTTNTSLLPKSKKEIFLDSSLLDLEKPIILTNYMPKEKLKDKPRWPKKKLKIKNKM